MNDEITPAPPRLPAELPDDEAVARIVAWMVRGQSDHAISEALADHATERREQLLAAVVEHFASQAECHLPALLGWAIEGMRECYRVQIEAGETVAAVKTLRAIVETATKHIVYDADQEREAAEAGDDPGPQ